MKQNTTKVSDGSEDVEVRRGIDIYNRMQLGKDALKAAHKMFEVGDKSTVCHPWHPYILDQ